MDPVTQAILSSWHWRPDVLLVLGGLGILYTIGWWRVRQRTRRSRWGQAASWRLLSYWSGLIIISLALLSPIEVLVQQLFVMHMFQHLLMIMIAPPLLLVANPMPMILWGLPDGVRRGVGMGIGRLLGRHAVFRHSLRSATGGGVMWLVWVVTLLGWHDPILYNAALESPLVHDIEHLTFFLASLLFWWRITGAGPHIHKTNQSDRAGSYPDCCRPSQYVFRNCPLFCQKTLVHLLPGCPPVMGVRCPLRPAVRWFYYVGAGEHDVYRSGRFFVRAICGR